MALSTYGELNTALAKLLDRDDLADQIPDFIRLLETSFDADPRVAKHRRRVCRAGADIASEYTPLPNNYISVQTLHIETGNNADPFKRLIYVSPENLADMADADAETGEPTHYTVVGTDLRVYPAPDKTYPGRLHVYERLPQLSAASDANWLLTYFPHVYLYGAALHSAPFLREDERLAVWGQLYDNAVEACAKSDPTPTNAVRLRTDLVGLTGR